MEEKGDYFGKANTANTPINGVSEEFITSITIYKLTYLMVAGLISPN